MQYNNVGYALWSVESQWKNPPCMKNKLQFKWQGLICVPTVLGFVSLHLLQFHTNWGMDHSWFVAQEIDIIEVKGIHIYILIVCVIL